jgi:hypothetical protein
MNHIHSDSLAFDLPEWSSKQLMMQHQFMKKVTL